MHARVQFCTQEWLAKSDEPERWRKQFIRLAAINFPDGELGNWERCQALLPHFQKLVDREAPNSESSIDRARLLHNMAWYMLKIGKASRALRLIGTALSNRAESTRLKSLGLTQLRWPGCVWRERHPNPYHGKTNGQHILRTRALRPG